MYLKPMETDGTIGRTDRKDSFLNIPRDDDDTIFSQGFEKGQAQHIERTSSSMGDGDRKASILTMATAETVDQQHRRKAIEMDDYAEACRAIAR